MILLEVERPLLGPNTSRHFFVKTPINIFRFETYLLRQGIIYCNMNNRLQCMTHLEALIMCKVQHAATTCVQRVIFRIWQLI